MDKANYILTLQKLGLRIKELRIEQNVTQKTLASLCDVDYRSIQRIEKGEQNISLHLFLSLSESLKVDPDELIKYLLADV